MARRKFRNQTPRYDSVSERSFQEYVSNVSAPLMSKLELSRLVRGGEDSYLELKVRLSNSEKIAQGMVALANTDGGIIIFGVSDQLRVEGVADAYEVRDEVVRICREDIVPPLVPLIDCVFFDNGRQIVVVEIEGKTKPYRTRDGRFYLRFGAEKREITREELSGWLNEIRPLKFENLPVIGATDDDIDDGLLWTFAREFAGDAFETKFHYETGEFLKKDLLLAAGNAEDLIPTIAAVLLFGKNDRVATLVPRSSVKMARYSGANINSPIIEEIEISGNLLTIYETAARFIARYADLWDSRPRSFQTSEADAPVRPRANYHRVAVLEALANLLTHRDLALRDVPTRIHVFDDSIEFINPRRTNGFVPPASRAIRYGISQTQSPQTVSLFKSQAYGANLPVFDLPSLLRESRLFSGRKTELIMMNDEFRLKMFGA